jgi:hypothetical protein
LTSNAVLIGIGIAVNIDTDNYSSVRVSFLIFACNDDKLDLYNFKVR